ncbi:MAG: hypothetical protein KDA75_12025 [Planctomycetaceae bacterium]|nr:hypothetical protein [Planctomycetaceae bacterium]
MTTYLVATLARYVLVEAADEHEARVKGQAALYDLYADLRERLGREVPIEIRTIRPATDEEIELMRWHNDMVDREMEWQARRHGE